MGSRCSEQSLANILCWSDGRCFRYGSAKTEQGATDSLRSAFKDSYFRAEGICVGKIRHPDGWVSYLSADKLTRQWRRD